MRIALVHDWFITTGGSEKVVSQILKCFPDIEIFSLFDFMDKSERGKLIGERSVKVSILQKVPFARKYYRALLPFYNYAIQNLDLSCFDIIISSSHVAAKNIKCRSDQIHISYCHTPARYAWDQREDYLEQFKNRLIRFLLSRQLDRFRRKDYKCSGNVHFYIANSNYISNRIQRCYHQDSIVIYPPVRTKFFYPNGHRYNSDDSYFLVLSRLVYYKRVDLIVKAFNHFPELKLKIVGEGPQMKNLKAISDSNTEFLGFVPDCELHEHIGKSRAVIFAANEDFGITCVEVQAAGKPVIALRDGGYLETVDENVSGVFFDQQNVDSLVESIRRFLSVENNFCKEDIINNASKFDEDVFNKKIKSFVNEKYKCK